jgi:hypothetical protein
VPLRSSPWAALSIPIRKRRCRRWERKLTSKDLLQRQSWKRFPPSPPLVLFGLEVPGSGMGVGCGKAVIGNARHIPALFGFRTGMFTKMADIPSFGADGNERNLDAGAPLANTQRIMSGVWLPASALCHLSRCPLSVVTWSFFARCSHSLSFRGKNVARLNLELAQKRKGDIYSTGDADKALVLVGQVERTEAVPRRWF